MLKKRHIENNADKIWLLLNTGNEYSIDQIANELQMKNDDILIALGWLMAQENEVMLYENEGKIMVTLKSETLYY
jgi:hypothetical protein